MTYFEETSPSCVLSTFLLPSWCPHDLKLSHDSLFLFDHRFLPLEGQMYQVQVCLVHTGTPTNMTDRKQVFNICFMTVNFYRKNFNMITQKHGLGNLLTCEKEWKQILKLYFQNTPTCQASDRAISQANSSLPCSTSDAVFARGKSNCSANYPKIIEMVITVKEIIRQLNRYNSLTIYMPGI